MTVSTRNKNNSVSVWQRDRERERRERGRRNEKKKRKERRGWDAAWQWWKKKRKTKLRKPLDNGEDIFSNEPRRVHSSANYTSTAFSVFRSTWLLSFQSQRNVGKTRVVDRGARRMEDGLPFCGTTPVRICSRSMLSPVPPSRLSFWAIKRETRNSGEEISQTINSKTNLKTKKLRWSASDAEDRFLSRWMPTSLHRRGAEAFGVAFDDRKGDQWIISFVIVVRRFCTPEAKDRIDVLRTFVPDIAFGERIPVGGELRILTVDVQTRHKNVFVLYPVLWFQSAQSGNYFPRHGHFNTRHIRLCIYSFSMIILKSTLIAVS